MGNYRTLIFICVRQHTYYIRKHMTKPKRQLPVGLPESKLLSLGVLDPLAKAAAAELAAEGDSANTLASYRSALRYWSGWFHLRFGGTIALPVHDDVVIQFIVDHATRIQAGGLVSELPADVDALLVANKLKARPGPPALATILHRISVLSKAHSMTGQPNPCVQPVVRELLTKTRRAYAKRGTGTGRKDAITRDPLKLMLATCDESLQGIRDKALLLFAWSSGGRRRSEVAHATVENVHREQPGRFAYNLSWSKTNQTGGIRPENYKPIIGVAGLALEDWLSKSGIKEGALFRRVRRGGHLAEGLSDSAVRRIVIRRAALAGLRGDFSAHSLRSGFVTEAGLQKTAMSDAMAMTGHASAAMFLSYYRAAELASSESANLMGDPDEAAAPGDGEI